MRKRKKMTNMTNYYRCVKVNKTNVYVQRYTQTFQWVTVASNFTSYMAAMQWVAAQPKAKMWSGGA